MSRYNGNVQKALVNLFPDIGIDPMKFRMYVDILIHEFNRYRIYIIETGRCNCTYMYNILIYLNWI